MRQTRSLAQAKIIAEILDQTFGFDKERDWTTIGRLAKTLNLARGTVSVHLQVLIEAGVLILTNNKGEALNTPMRRKQIGLARQKLFFQVPPELVLTDDKLLLLRTKRKDFSHVLKKDKLPLSNKTSQRLIKGQNIRKETRDIQPQSAWLERQHGLGQNINLPIVIAGLCEQCSKPVATVIANVTRKRYGRLLCMSCYGRLPIKKVGGEVNIS